MFATDTAPALLTTAAPAGTSAIRPRGLGVLPRITSAHVALVRHPLLAARLAPAALAVAEHLASELGTQVKVEARLQLLAPSPLLALAHPALFALFELADNSRAVLEVDAHGAARLSARLLGRAVGAADVGALGWLVLGLLDAARAATPLDDALAPRFVSVLEHRSQALERLDVRQRHLVLRVAAQFDGARTTGRLILPSAMVTRAAQGFPKASATALHPSLAAAAQRALVRGGTVLVSPATLETLSVGEVLRVHNLTWERHGLAGPVTVGFPRFLAVGALTREGLTLSNVAAHAQLAGGPMQDDRTELIAPLPIELSIELTRLSVPLSELATLRAGAVLPLHVGSNQPVTLRIGERAFARAELVDVDGEVAVRVLRILG